MSQVEPPAVAEPEQQPPPAEPARMVGGLDCSPEQQAKRRQRLQELEDIYYSGATSMSDRNRSVQFGSRRDIGAAILNLRNELAACDTGIPLRSGAPRIFHMPQGKEL